MHKILCIIGISLCLLPFCLQTLTKYEFNAQIDTIHTQIQSKNTCDTILKKAREYNRQIFNREDYEKQLNPLQDGYMATIQIDAIQVNLPIYHNTTEDILSKGIGHIPWSSLPVGGKSTHTILTGHSGCAKCSFFNRLDELKKSDRIQIHVCNQTLEYKVIEKYKVLPNQIESLQIQEGKDLLSLITCTPFGINTHRLIVRCERVK